METYSIAQVETLTGIHAHTLRIWEKRYGFIIPERTDTKIRYYSDAQLKTLLNVSVLLDAGFKISKLAKMSHSELSAVSLEIQSSTASDQTDVKALIISMIDFEESRFEEIFQISVIRRGLLQTIVSVIYPFLHQVGVLWSVTKVMPAQEHFISNLIRRKLLAAIDALPTSKHKQAKKVILFLPENEHHEIGLLLAYYIFKNAGWMTIYLGANVPIENITVVEKQTDSNVLCTLLISPVIDPIKRFSNILENINTELVVSGNPALLPKQSKGPKYHRIDSPNDLISFVGNYK